LLGIDWSITGLDFLNGVAVAIGASTGGPPTLSRIAIANSDSEADAATVRCRTYWSSKTS